MSAAEASSSSGAAFPVVDDSGQHPEVLAQIVDDMDDVDDDEAEEGMEQIVDPALTKLGTFIPPRAPGSALAVERTSEGVHVRLTLSVGAAGSMLPPGLEIADCGVCTFCRDKPKYGGGGTKRQKCELKQQEAAIVFDNRDPRVWCGLHLITDQEMMQMREIQKLPLPEPITQALEKGALPLVWAYKRKRRARTLPPAFVLMYHCEGRVALDRSHLALSRQRYFKNSRSDLNGDPEKAAKVRKPRVPRVRHPAEMQLQYAASGQYDMAPLAVATTTMGDPSQGWGTPGATCVYAQPVGAGPPMYPGSSYAPAYGQPGPIMYGAQPVMYEAQPQIPIMYAPPQPMMATQPPSAGRHGKSHAGEEEAAMSPGAAAGGAFYPAPDQSQYYSQPPSAYVGMHSSEQMEEEANSWIMDPPAGGEGSADGTSPSGRAGKRAKKGGRAAVEAAPEPAGEAEGDQMSNKTLEIMLSRLQGQLPPQTYEKVIALVRDVQMRRMSLSRSEFLQHFQAICAGAPKPR